MKKSKELKKKLNKERQSFEHAAVTYFDNNYKYTSELMQLAKENKEILRDYNDKIKDIKDDFTEKTKKCILCSTDYKGVVKIDGPCKSHNIPAFILKNVEGTTNKGQKRLATISTIVPNINYAEYLGVGNCDTFKLICRSCDSKFFSKYENASNLLELNPENKLDTQDMLSKIALKILFKDVYFYNTTHSLGEFSEINKNISEKVVSEALKPKKEYNLVYLTKLDYNVGFTVQDKILPNYVMEGKILHDLTSEELDNDECYLYICVYPIGSETLVLVFSDAINNSFYTDYKKYLDNSSEELALKNISYNLLKFTEKIYFNPNTFTKDLWTENDALLLMSEYFEYQAYPYSNFGIKRTFNSDDYLKLKYINAETVTNLFEVNKPKNK